MSLQLRLLHADRLVLRAVVAKITVGKRGKTDETLLGDPVGAGLKEGDIQPKMGAGVGRREDGGYQRKSSSVQGQTDGCLVTT